ncbi:hypothetical protein CN571_27375 [Bacillus pseudomycoides]|uniref:Uncharacterized protein n=1 Tax=Bacillus pseudomycoides TaxID=64104 RepID=A0AAJ3R6J8_9BACI|nr:putative membrane protein [Bacillus pseudomycoides]MDR4188542.1 hypothetical protein [Bacillus pseudomycoides]MDR4326771.1 hypothetical protein [Bacillus pseudomycoides]PEO48318.1 hypothetical protein CN559_12350 [Bacillus pseudomycoides]PEO80464.1 hypothetical protein CN571_27375 [Bacillus pseudomycoides]
MQSLKMVKFNIWIFGILFITNAIEFISVLTTDHKFDWLKAFCAIGFSLVFIINLFDLKNKNYKTT